MLIAGLDNWLKYFKFLLATTMLSSNDHELTAAKTVHRHIVCQQANMLAKMQPLESVVQEQQEEDQRVRKGDALCVIAAEEAAWVAEVKAARKTK